MTVTSYFDEGPGPPKSSLDKLTTFLLNKTAIWGLNIDIEAKSPNFG